MKNINKINWKKQKGIRKRLVENYKNRIETEKSGLRTKELNGIIKCEWIKQEKDLLQKI